ncbi:MAG: sigma-70 family RNA polymerase sigma factor [Opitutaceae bacterium]|nr:sigma-70 family RNA polymerase sigma factor [Opitutaceae bacterium]
MIANVDSAQAAVSAAAGTPEHARRQRAPAEDVDLLLRVGQCDTIAFERLYDRFSSPMFSLVLRMVGSRAQAEDILQEVFLLIWIRARDYRQQLGSPFAWIATIMRHKAIDWLRAQGPRFRYLDTAPDQPAPHFASLTGEDRLIATERNREVRSAIAALGVGEHRAIELAFFDGLTHAEIAAALHLPVGTVKARIRRGLLKLRLQLTPLVPRVQRTAPNRP